MKYYIHIYTYYIDTQTYNIIHIIIFVYALLSNGFAIIMYMHICFNTWIM